MDCAKVGLALILLGLGQSREIHAAQSKQTSLFLEVEVAQLGWQPRPLTHPQLTARSSRTNHITDFFDSFKHKDLCHVTITPLILRCLASFFRQPERPQRAYKNSRAVP